MWRAAQQAVNRGIVLLVLSDKYHSSVTPIPAPMAVGAVQKALVDNNLRCDANIVETASAVIPTTSLYY